MVEAMRKNFFERGIPAWVALLILILGIGAFAAVSKIHPLRQDAYTFTVKDASGQDVELTYGSLPALSNPEFYKNVKQSFINEKESFVEANLSEMKIRVYKDGAVIKEVPILTKGKKGSWWETPAGLYKAEDKLEKHRSSFSPVYTDWNIHFQGNFFIHGWPYWVDSGEDVTSTYSGGCIRLSTEDAKTVYDLTAVGTPILVFEDAPDLPPHAYETNIPNTTSKTYLVADLENNFVFLSSTSTAPTTLPIAAKLLTALVATEYMDIERSITVRGGDLVATDNPRLSAGTHYTVYDLLFPLLLEGSDESASALHGPLGDSYFTSLMNTKAKSIGMTNTKIHSDGELETADTTAEDAFNLAKYLYNYRKFILDLSHGVITNNAYTSMFSSIHPQNPLASDADFLGGMIDTSGSDQSAISVFNVTFSGEKRPVAVVVLDSEDAAADTKAMVNYVKQSFK